MIIKVKDPPACPHCQTMMIRYELPPISFSDGLGWGAPFLWACPSDDCPIFRKGFEHTMNNYGQSSSLRSIIEPDSGCSSVVPGFTMDKEHFKKFVEIRKETIESMRSEPPPVQREEDDDWMDDDDSYDPDKGFTQT